MSISTSLHLDSLLITFQVSTTWPIESTCFEDILPYFIVGMVLDWKKSKAEDLVEVGGTGT